MGKPGALSPGGLHSPVYMFYFRKKLKSQANKDKGLKESWDQGHEGGRST